MIKYYYYLLIICTAFFPTLASSKTLCNINYILIKESVYSKSINAEENIYLEASNKFKNKKLQVSTNYNLDLNINQLFKNTYNLSVSKNSITLENLNFVFTNKEQYTDKRNYFITTNGNTILLSYYTIGNRQTLTLVNKERYLDASLERQIEMDCQDYDKSTNASNSYIDKYPDFFQVLIWNSPVAQKFQQAKEQNKENRAKKYKEYLENKKQQEDKLSKKRKRDFLEKEQNKIDLKVEEQEKKQVTPTSPSDNRNLPRIDQI